MDHDVGPVRHQYKDEAFAFESEGEMWQTGYQLILDLRRLRGLSHELTPQPDEAERELNLFCFRLRRSDPDLSLPRIQRIAHLSNGHVAALVSVLASCWVGRFPSAINHVAITAIGFSPIRLHAFVDALHSRQGFGALMNVINGSLAPSTRLIGMLSESLSVEDVIAFRESLKRTPSAGRSGIPDNMDRFGHGQE